MEAETAQRDLYIGEADSGDTNDRRTKLMEAFLEGGGRTEAICKQVPGAEKLWSKLRARHGQNLTQREERSRREEAAEDGTASRKRV